MLAFFSNGWFALSLQLGGLGYAIWPPSIAFPGLSSQLLFFPALYFYVRKLVRAEEPLSRKWFLHFIPFLIFLVWFLMTNISSPGKLNSIYLPLPLKIMITVSVFLSLFYNFLIYKLFLQNQVKFKDEYSDDNVFITLDWLKWMIWVLAFLPVLGVFNFLFEPFMKGFPAMSLSFLTMLLYCSMLSLFSFRQPVLYQNSESPVLSKEPSEARQFLKSKIGLEEEEFATMAAELEKYMIDRKPFLDPKIRMPELATNLNIPRHIFSYLINEHYGMNFFTFINQYRVRYAVQLLESEARYQYSMEAIGQMSGFQSKSTFNSRFKEIMGNTPSEWARNRPSLS